MVHYEALVSPDHKRLYPSRLVRPEIPAPPAATFRDGSAVHTAGPEGPALARATALCEVAVVCDRGTVST